MKTTAAPGPDRRRLARADGAVLPAPWPGSALPSGGRRAVLALPLALALAGCGFELRKTPQFAFKTIRLAMPDTALSQQIDREITATHQARVVSDPAQAQVTLVSTGERRERASLSLNSAGEVLEYELRLRFAFRITGPGGRDLVPPTEIMRHINQSYSDTAALSKEAEAQLLYQSMQDDIVQQVLRRLTRVNPDAPPASGP